MQITIMGLPGSGKSVLAKKLKDYYNLKHYSMGDMRREYAKRKGMTLAELNKFGESNFETDEFCDNFQQKLAKTQNIILDGRLSWFFIPQSIKIYLDVSFEEAANRIKQHSREEEFFKTITEGIEKIKERIESDKKRYLKYYNLNPYDKENFDIYIDSTNLNINEVFEKAVEEIEIFKRKH